MKKITFCEQNFEMGTKAVYEHLQSLNLKEFELRITRCLGECGECFSNCIADFHGKLLVEKTADELLSRIITMINEN